MCGGAQGVNGDNTAKAAFCGFHSCITQCVLSVKVFVRLNVDAETAQSPVVSVRSLIWVWGSQTLTYEQRGNYRQHLWPGVAHEL